MDATWLKNDTQKISAYLAYFGAPNMVSLKKSCKMQFRRVGLRSIGPSSQKLQPNLIFGRSPHCNYNVNVKVVARADLWVYNTENFCVSFFNKVA